MRIAMRTHTRSATSLLCLALALAGAFFVGACGERQDPVLLLSADEALEMGKQFLADEKYQKARRHLIHAFEVEPNSRSGREALLLAADALYLQGSTENYIKCEAKYRDFLNRFPTSDRSDYAQYKVAECLSGRAERPDRDQQVTRDALDAYEELLRLYPDSEFVPEARQRMRDLVDRLAQHELVVANFYNRYGGRGICDAAIGRLEHLRENFPQFSAMDEALWELIVAYTRCRKVDDAEEALADLRRRFPDSVYLAEADAWEADELVEAREQFAAAKAAIEAAEKTMKDKQQSESSDSESADDGDETTSDDPGAT